MWLAMVLSYIIVAYIDTKGLKRLNEKGMLPLYIALMTVSWAIGTADLYVANMPSPARLIENLILSLIGR